MKVDNIEINGFNHVVIYNEVEFRKVNDQWERTRDGKVVEVMSHAHMVDKIKKFTYSPWNRVWIRENTVNITNWD